MKINGNLVFDSASGAEIQNLRVEKLTGDALNEITAGANDVGRLVFVTTASTGGTGRLANVLYQGKNVGGTYSFVAVAGNVQEEIDALESSLGSMVNGDGTFNGQAFVTANATIWPTAPASLTAALDTLSDFATGKDTLEEIEPVGAQGNIIYASSGSEWSQAAPGSTSGVQPYDAELAALAGLTSAADQLPYFTGAGTAALTTLSSFARGLIDDADASAARSTLGVVIGTDVQAYDAGLGSLAAMAAAGIVTVDATGNVFTARALAAPAAGITISNTDGGGTMTFGLANDLAALEGLATNGIIVRTGDGTATTRSISGTESNIVVTNGDGVAGGPVLNLATVSQASSGSFVKVTLDGFGRVTGNTAVVAADITGLVDNTYVNVSGDTMSGALAMGNNKITGLAAPEASGDAATKNYVDSVASGLSWKEPVNSVGAANPGTATTGDRFLNTTDYKIYTATATNTWDAGVAPADGWAVFDRATETGYVYPGTGAWVQFTGTGQITAGTSLSKDGNTLNVNVGAGLMDDADNLTLRIASGSALSKVQGLGTNELALLLDTGSGLSQSGTGLKISTGGVTNSMLANSSVGVAADTGTAGTLSLGGSLTVNGTAAQGIDTSVTGTTITVTAKNASDTQKGVASFGATEFTVTTGAVALATAGVANSKLANSTITVSDGVATDAVALGETLTVSGSGAITTAVTANAIGISVATATDLVKGVASFASADFSVTSGAVSLVGKNLDSLTDVAVSSAAAGQTLVNNGTDFVNRKVYHLHTQAVAGSTWTVTHGIGQQFCNVTVVDASDQVIIPNSITFDSTTGLTVTFTSAIAGKVVVMGVNSAA